MSITTSAGDGVRITTAAVSETAGSQTQQCGSDQVVFSDDFNTLDNGNVCTCITYPCRLVMVRRGTCTEETRIAVSEAAGTGTTMIVTVHEDWCTPPAACDQLDVSYVLQDAATVTGLGLINKRVQDYSSTRKFRIGNAGGCPAFAWFATLNGASLETVDNSSTTCPDIRLENNGRWSNGFISNGTGTGGGYIIGTPAVSQELVFDGVNGAQYDWEDQLFITNVNAPELRIGGACSSGIIKIKNVFGTRTFRIDSPNITYTCLNVVGKGTVSDGIDLGQVLPCQSYTFTNVEMDSAKFKACGVVGTQSNTFNIVNFNVKRAISTIPSIIDARCCGLSWTTTWNVINPKWTVSGSSEFALDTACSVISEQFRQNVTVQEVSGTKISGAILNHISTRSGTSAIRLTTSSNACGLATLDTEARRWTGPCETLASSTAHGLQTHNYSRTSFATVPTLANQAGGFGQTVTVAVQTDPFVVEATEATALADGTTKATICENQTQPHSIIKYTSGTGTLTVGKWVGVCNGACAPTIYGKLKEIYEGDSVAGTVVLNSRAGATFTTNLVEYECSACAPSSTKLDWTGSLTACSQQCFTWQICVGQISCSPRTIQQAYDHMKAKLHECPIDTTDNWDDVKRWGVGEFAHPIQGVDSNASPKTFKTVRNVTNGEGWLITGASGYGPITQFTDDSGTAFTFASTVPIEIKVVEAEDFVTPIACARVNIRCQAGTTEIMNTLTNACGIASLCYPTPACPINVFVRARKEVEEYVKQPGTISVTSGLSLTIGVKDDPRYSPT